MAFALNAEELDQAKAKAEQDEARLEALCWLDDAARRARTAGRIQRADLLIAIRRFLQHEAA